MPWAFIRSFTVSFQFTFKDTQGSYCFSENVAFCMYLNFNFTSVVYLEITKVYNLFTYILAQFHLRMRTFDLKRGVMSQDELQVILGLIESKQFYGFQKVLLINNSKISLQLILRHTYHVTTFTFSQRQRSILYQMLFYFTYFELKKTRKKITL